MRSSEWELGGALLIPDGLIAASVSPRQLVSRNPRQNGLKNHGSNQGQVLFSSYPLGWANAARAQGHQPDSSPTHSREHGLSGA